uniref:Uncharacterized protein n=1 Tax=viral metagenome TaxID=1070528 RepID=A0A6M3J8Y2_9ZZZZ
MSVPRFVRIVAPGGGVRMVTPSEYETVYKGAGWRLIDAPAAVDHRAGSATPAAHGGALDAEGTESGGSASAEEEDVE